MDVSIQEVKDYTYIVSKIQNICLIPCRYLFNLKRKVKNKMHFEVLICKVYIVEEISTFISYYFKLLLRTKINSVLRYDDGGRWWENFFN
jgi:hypothetical protein